ncbi:SNAP receptor use1 [Actinomortierella ambigua]|nr:SNAP receptor use1 [Actinomortierella ambigua]
MPTAMANIPLLMATPIPSALEVNFRRLMAKCDAIVQGSERILQGTEREKYLANVRVLGEMLLDLEEEATYSGQADLTALKEYSRKVDSLASMLDGSKLISPVNKSLSQTRMITHTIQTQAEKNRENENALKMSRRAEREMRTELFQDTTKQGASQSWSDNAPQQLRERRPFNESSALRISDSGIGGGGGSSSSSNLPQGQAQVEAALQNDRAAREEMENGLSILMQQLRHNALAINQTLMDERNSGLLDEADMSLDRNISRLGKERARLELYSKQSRKTKWIIWGIILLVCLVFVFMFFVIRIF